MRALPFLITVALVPTLLAAPTQARAQDAGPAHIALFQTTTDDESLHDLAAALDPVLAAELARNEHVTVSERPALDLPAMQLALDCVAQTADCLRSVTDQTHVEGLLAATLRGAGSETVLTLLYFDARGIGTMKGSTRKHTGDNVEQDTLDGVPAMLAELFGEAQPAPAASEEATPAPPEVTLPDDTDTSTPRASVLPIGPIVLGASGVVLVGVGSAFGLAANSSEDDYAKLPAKTRADATALRDKLDTAKTQAVLCNLGIGIGAAAVVGSVVWWVLSRHHDHHDHYDYEAADQAALAPIVGPHELGLRLHATFAGGI